MNYLNLNKYINIQHICINIYINILNLINLVSELLLCQWQCNKDEFKEDLFLFWVINKCS